MKSRILSFMADPSADEFEALALDLFRYQWDRNEAYRRLAESAGVRPEAVQSWDQIPPVSTTVFKRLRLTCGEPTLVFRTSGTTRGPEGRGEHHLVDADLYRESLQRSFRHFVLPEADRDRWRLLIVGPTREWAPESSLGFMLSEVLAAFGTPASRVVLRPAGLDVEAARAALDTASADGEPLVILGTNLGLDHLLERLERNGLSWKLPDGSRIMDTGGSKGVSREVPRFEQLARYERTLAIPPHRVVNEYGMTELGSQFYDASLLGGDPGVKLGPHWVRTRVIDPGTGRTAPDGTPGLLVHLDLANMDSVAAIETEDLGFISGDGFVLTGRAAGAEPRGCSIATDALLSEGNR
jgi:hypothetical protein